MISNIPLIKTNTEETQGFLCLPFNQYSFLSSAVLSLQTKHSKGKFYSNQRPPSG